MNLREIVRLVSTEIAGGIADARAAGVQVSAATDIVVVLPGDMIDGVETPVERFSIARVEPGEIEIAPNPGTGVPLMRPHDT